MGGSENLMTADVTGGAGREVFAMTDEQILEIGPEEEVASDEWPFDSAQGGRVADKDAEANHDRSGATGAMDSSGEKRESRGNERDRERAAEGLRPESLSYRAEPPGWLAREMRDPWVGEEARELWEGVQRAQKEAAEFREVIGSPEEARALKEIYPGGLAEAKSAAERARELGEIDALFFGAAGKSTEVVRAGRMQLAERLHAHDPAAFREMVEAGVRILGGVAGRSNEEGKAGPNTTNLPRSLHSEPQTARLSGREDSRETQGPAPELVNRYQEFERAANAELERSVGGAIGRAMDAALPNLKWAESGTGRDGQGHPLQARLRTAVREDVETALRSDASLGEQVARVLSGRRFDEAARAQVVRLIDARAQQLVPGAVRRAVGIWTAATLGGKKAESGAEERRSISTARTVSESRSAIRNERGRLAEPARQTSRGRVDYRKWSDEEILGM